MSGGASGWWWPEQVAARLSSSDSLASLTLRFSGGFGPNVVDPDAPVFVSATRSSQSLCWVDYSGLSLSEASSDELAEVLATHFGAPEFTSAGFDHILRMVREHTSLRTLG